MWSLLHQIGKVCLHCAYPRCGDSLFCEACEKNLWRRHQKNFSFEMKEFGFKCETLFEWIPDEDRQLSLLLSELKGGRQNSTYDLYARKFLSQLQGKLSADVCLVPCPSRTGEFDHALAFAQSLSKYIGIPIQNVLSMPLSSGKQKVLDREGRLGRLLKLKARLPCENVIFIDDILTSGATAQSARRALNPSGSFWAWALAHRRDLAVKDPL